MTDLLKAVLDWHSVVAVLVLFGMAPGAVLRLVVRLYPKGHPRREELVAELYALPYSLRPLWVAEQIETSFFDGMRARRSRHCAAGQPEAALVAQTVQVSRAAGILSLLDERERIAIAYPEYTIRELALLLGAGPSQAHLIRQRAVDTLREQLRGDIDGEELALTVLRLARNSLDERST